MVRFICLVTLIVGMVIRSTSADVHLIYSGEWVQGSHRYLPTKFFRLEDPAPPLQPSLIEVQSVAIPGMDFWHEVHVVPEHGLVMVIVNTPAGRIHSVELLPMDDLSMPYSVSWDDPRVVRTIRSIVNDAAELLLEVRFVEGEPTVLSVKTGETVGLDCNSIPPASSQITGPRCLHQLVDISSDRRVVATHPNTIVPLPQESVPVDIQLSKAPRWAIYAAEPEYLAFKAGYDRKHQPECQLLVRRADNGDWKSYMVHGGSTQLRVMGGWFVGIEKEMDPRSDPAASVWFPGIRTDNVVFINPMTGTHIVAPLGLESEVLLIQNDQVLFRRGSRLYRAAISSAGISNEQLIVDDPRIVYVQWAFIDTSKAPATTRPAGE